MTRLRAALVLVALVAAGCMQPSEPSPTTGGTTATTTAAPTGTAHEENFDAVPANQVPAGWLTINGAWGALVNATDAAHPNVMRGAGADPPGLSSLVAMNFGTYQDFELLLNFKMVDGDAGAGVVFHWADEENCQIIRYSIRENGWHLFTVIDGDRLKKNEATVAGDSTHPDYDEWVTLRVTSQNEHVEAFHGTTKVIDYDLPADAATVGAVGPFSRATTVAEFDDLHVEPL